MPRSAQTAIREFTTAALKKMLHQRSAGTKKRGIDRHIRMQAYAELFRRRLAR